MLKYTEKTPFTHNIRSIVHCRKGSMKQNVENKGGKINQLLK